MRIIKAIVIMCVISFISLLSLPQADAFGGKITSLYGYRIHPIWGRGMGHGGVDLGVEYGTALPAVVSGTITDMGWQGADPHSGYGRYLEIQDDKTGKYFIYAHLDSYAVTQGQHVNQGDIVAYCGLTGATNGPHLHLTVYTSIDAEAENGGDREDPLPYMIAAGWNLEGDTSGNTIGSGIKEIFGKVIPSITYDMDWAEYFKPSEILANAAKSMFEYFTKAMDHIKDNLRNILILLCVLDLLWYLAKTCMEVEEFTAHKLAVKGIRYGFFVAVWDSWRALFKDIFLPLYEEVASLYGGSTVTVTDMLSFDSLYNQLSQILGNNLHLTWVFNPVTGVPGLGTFIMCNLFVCLILAVSILLCLYILVRISYFYVVCIFGVLGLPIALIPYLKVSAGTFLGSILNYALELAFTASMFSILLKFLESLPPVEADSPTGLLLFLIQFGFVTYITINCSKWSKHFSSRFSL